MKKKKIKSRGIFWKSVLAETMSYKKFSQQILLGICSTESIPKRKQILVNVDFLILTIQGLCMYIVSGKSI